MQETIRVLKARANTAYFEGVRSAQFAEQARAEYRRLARENRARFAARGYPPEVADAHFGNYAVSRDCIESEQMHGRWATERFACSSAGYQQVERLMGELTAFLRQRRASRPAPKQRSGS